jgi:hypothetical protein
MGLTISIGRLLYVKGCSWIDSIELGQYAVYNNLAKRKLLLCVLGFCVGTGHVSHVIQAGLEGLQPVTDSLYKEFFETSFRDTPSSEISRAVYNFFMYTLSRVYTIYY